jgi:hypothetical protein
MAPSPYDLRKKTRRAQLDQARVEAQSRMETVAKLERRGHYDTPNGPRPMGDTSQARLIPPGGPAPRARPEGRTGRAEVINGQKFPSVAGPRRDAQTRKVWETALGVNYSPSRRAARGELLVRGDRQYYRRKRDGKAIPIDSNGNVIRNRSGK